MDSSTHSQLLSLLILYILQILYSLKKRTIPCDPLLSQWCAGEELKSVLLLTIESISLIMVWGNIDLKLISDNLYYFAWYSKQTFKNKLMWAWWMYLSIPANTTYWPNAIPMLVLCLQNWFRIKTRLGLKIVFVGMIITNPWSNSAVQSHRAISAYFQVSRYCLLVYRAVLLCLFQHEATGPDDELFRLVDSMMFDAVSHARLQWMIILI